MYQRYGNILFEDTDPADVAGDGMSIAEVKAIHSRFVACVERAEINLSVPRCREIQSVINYYEGRIIEMEQAHG